MGVDVKPLLFVGKVFHDRAAAIKWFKAHRTLTEHDLDGIGDELFYYLEEHKNKGFPQGQTLDAYNSDCYVYIGYDVYHKNPDKLKENIDKYSKMWEEFFNDKPQVVLEARWW